MLQGLMDKLLSGHTHIEGNDICFMCEKVGEITPASSWCSVCEVTLCRRCAKMHLEGPATKKHDLFDLSGEVKIKERKKDSCKEHEGERLGFICKDCNRSVCQICCVAKHRACKHVVTIDSVIPEIKSALIKKRCIFGQMLEANIAACRRDESRIEQVRMNERRTETELKSAVNNTITLLRKKEKELLKVLRSVSGKQIAELQATVKSSDITTQVYQQYCQFIDQALQSESEVDMYDMYQVCLSEAVEFEAVRESDARNSSVEEEVKFTPDMEPLHKAIAEIEKIDGTFLTGKRDLDAMTAILHDTIDIKPVTSNSVDPIDVTVVTVDGVQTLVVADYKAASLTSVFVRNNRKHMSRLILTTAPHRLTKTTGKRIAATAAKMMIMISEVNPEMGYISSIKTNKQYWGITSLPDSTLAVGSSSPQPSAVDILDLSGNVLRSFTRYNTGLNLIRNPDDLCTTNEGNILVSDWGTKSVYCLTPEGGVVFTYKPTGLIALDRPRGITVTNTGDILLADSESGRVLQLTSAGTYVRDVLTSADGIDKPCGLSVDETSRLYVCDRGRDKHIKIYSLT